MILPEGNFSIGISEVWGWTHWVVLGLGIWVSVERCG